MSDLPYLSWLEAAARIRARSLSSVEYTRALIDRIQRYDRNLDSFISLDVEGALAAAEAADDAIARGDATGPMHGVPFALKDIVDRAGMVTTCHSRILEHNVAREDAEITRRLIAAGGVLLGKLATHEFAIGGPCFDLPWPPARNPWNRDHFTGGSSSGSGAAVAAGFVPAAIGTDTAGSVRNPATACGIVGMKPTYDRVSRRGVFPLSWSLDTVGPMTRSVSENAAMLEVLADGSFSHDLDAGVKDLRIGVVRHFHERDIVADDAVAGAIESALETLSAQGARLSEITTRPLREFAECNRVLLLSEAYAVHEKWLTTRPEDYGALTCSRIMPGAHLRAVEYVQAMRMRRVLTDALLAAMSEVDVLLVVSSHDPPCRVDDADAIERTYQRQARAPFNLTGQPALAMPCGFSSDGLPIGVQIAARPYQEALIYRVARAYERASGFTERHPELA